jgi:alpha-amylase
MKAWFTSNHDENSWNGTEYEKYGDAAKALAVFSCTWPGIPLIYSGQELPNHKRLQFFEKDPIEWNGNNRLHGFYETLLKLHSTNPALSGDAQIAPVERLHSSAADKVLVYLRSSSRHKVLTLLNLSNDIVHIQINDERVSGEMGEIFSKTINDFTNNKNFEMQPWSYLVFEK